MQGFNTTQFNTLMGEAVQLHNQRHYQEALALSMQAYDMAPDDSIEKGRAARDNSARYDRLEQPAEAEEWADKAFGIHNNLVENMETPTREVLRERSVSAMYIGVNGLRKAIQAIQSGEAVDTTNTLAKMRMTWSDLEDASSDAKGFNKLDQYQINASRRVSLAESIIGNRKRGLLLGMQAVGLSFLSESPRINAYTPELTTKQRLQAKVKAFAGGVAALGVGILASPTTNRRQKLALTIADKTL